MEKRIKRASVDITIGSKDGSPLKDFPNIENLSMKYGVTNSTPSVNDEKGNASNNNLATQLAESSLMLAREKELEYQQKIDEKNKRIEQLCIMLEALEITPGVDPQKIQKLINEGLDENADFRDSKIVSLAKKSHKLTMQVNKEKAVNDKLNIQLSDAQKTIETLNQELQTAKLHASNRSDTKSYNRNADTSAADHTATIAGLSRDLKETNKVVDDLKSKLVQSVEESKKLSRALTRELGEGVTLDQAVDGGWRGRAQQIIMLKAKVTLTSIVV
jgi:predicted RNase H-like nuclease (RuvC/YqgF family)